MRFMNVLIGLGTPSGGLRRSKCLNVRFSVRRWVMHDRGGFTQPGLALEAPEEV